jgi:transposase
MLRLLPSTLGCDHTEPLPMPPLLHARPPADPDEQRTLGRLAASRHAPADWILRARIVVRSWDGERTSQIAAGLGCHPKTVRQWLHRFNTHGVDGLGDRPRSGRPRRLDQTERGQLVALVGQDPTGRLVRQADGTLAAVDPQQPGVWTLDALVQAAHELGIAIERSQVRRILLEEGARWRHPRSWTASNDPEFVPKGPGSSTSILTRRPG